MRLQGLGFDVYGTLVDPLELGGLLSQVAGEQALPLAALWREKQLEYTWRRGLMGRYENFDVCTVQALQYALAALGLQVTEAEQRELIARYGCLSPFADVEPGLQALRLQGHRPVAFSNGVAATLRGLLGRAGVLGLLDDVVSVDEVQRFKPDPAVYLHLAQRLSLPPQETWLVSSNGWDVIGAKAAGLRAAWIRRDATRLFDPWEYAPDLIASDLLDLAAQLGGTNAAVY